MACGVIATFYCYERWWRSGRTRDLIALTLVALLAFLNHYNAGAATMLALAAWHLMFRGRATTPRQWLALAAGGAVVVALGTAYLAWVGATGGERTGWTGFTGTTGIVEYRGAIPLFVPRVAIYTRELFTTDWISWPVLLWFLGMLVLPLLRRRRELPPAGEAPPAAGKAGSSRGAPGASEARAAAGVAPAPGGELPLAAAGRVVLMGALFALFAAALSLQPVWMFSF